MATMRVDIVSDVMCPWCIVGYRQLNLAAENCGVQLELHWQPFELNPQMPIAGQNLREHLIEKYGISEQDSNAARAQLTELGQQLGVQFNFSDDKRIYNTFQAHQLLHWAQLQGKDHALKLALFEGYFSAGKNIADRETLLDIAESVGLERNAAAQVLAAQEYAQAVRDKQQFWHSQGITGVPAMIFRQRHLVTGAQGEQNYSAILQQLSQAGD